MKCCTEGYFGPTLAFLNTTGMSWPKLSTFVTGIQLERFKGKLLSLIEIYEPLTCLFLWCSRELHNITVINSHRCYMFIQFWKTLLLTIHWLYCTWILYIHCVQLMMEEYPYAQPITACLFCSYLCQRHLRVFYGILAKCACMCTGTHTLTGRGACPPPASFLPFSKPQTFSCQKETAQLIHKIIWGCFKKTICEKRASSVFKCVISEDVSITS